MLNTNLRSATTRSLQLINICFVNEIRVNLSLIGFLVVGSMYGLFELNVANVIECIFSITYYMKTAVVSPYDNKFVYFCYRYWMSLKTSLCSTADTT